MPKGNSHTNFFFCAFARLHIACKIAPSDCLYACPCVIPSPWAWSGRSDGMSPQRWGYRSLWLPSGVFLLIFLACSLSSKPGVMLKAPLGRGSWGEEQGRPPANSEELSLSSTIQWGTGSCQQPREHRSGSSFVWAIRRDHSSGWQPAVSSRALSQLCLTRLSRFLATQNSEIANVCYFKLINVGFVCYAAIDN